MVFGCTSRAVAAHLALESEQRGPVAGLLGSDELDGTGPTQADVLGQINLPHPAASESLLQAVLTQLASLEQVLTQLGNLVRAIDGRRRPKAHPDAYIGEDALEQPERTFPEADGRRDRQGTEGDDADHQGAAPPGVGHEEAIEDQEGEPVQHAGVAHQVEQFYLVALRRDGTPTPPAELVDLVQGEEKRGRAQDDQLGGAQGPQRHGPRAPQDPRGHRRQQCGGDLGPEDWVTEVAGVGAVPHIEHQGDREATQGDYGADAHPAAEQALECHVPVPADSRDRPELALSTPLGNLPGRIERRVRRGGDLHRTGLGRSLRDEPVQHPDPGGHVAGRIGGLLGLRASPAEWERHFGQVRPRRVLSNSVRW